MPSIRLSLFKSWLLTVLLSIIDYYSALNLHKMLYVISYMLMGFSLILLL